MLCPACGTIVDERDGACPQCLYALPASAAGLQPETAAAVPIAPAAAPEHPCPVHPAYPVAGTCERCGAFICIQCAPALAERDKVLCPACETLAAAPEPGRP